MNYYIALNWVGTTLHRIVNIYRKLNLHRTYIQWLTKNCYIFGHRFSEKCNNFWSAYCPFNQKLLHISQMVYIFLFFPFFDNMPWPSWSDNRQQKVRSTDSVQRDRNRDLKQSPCFSKALNSIDKMKYSEVDPTLITTIPAEEKKTE